MSQQSDIYSSSLYEGDLTATLTPLPTLTETLSSSYIDSDGPVPFTSEPHISQQSFTSAPNSNFVQSPSIPSNLTRIRPNRLTEFVLYTSMDKEVHFDQIASATDGLPKVKCQRYGKILDHLGHTKAGTISIGRHLKGEKCRRAAQQAQQSSIRRLIQDEASRPSKSNQAVSKEDWEAELINTIAILRLPFQIVEHL
ncbi:hypothetical protein N7492_009696 [Penicillium capsulatum]|uniref:Uncharacterized protein n=1 Tax=Penicillium capsulatum TaxID=69766 RepID=A0A9W9HQ81_9EURO|nr:hypothetical protein N7492_009696 [Penicillium capsulatum]KAJ6114222.1 hypothetical protein N7512_007667 [Penicillium capsulatum]